MTHSSVRVRTAARVLLALWTATMAIAFFLPGEIVERTALFSPDKLIHMSVFAIWAGLAVVGGAPVRAVFVAGGVFAAATEAVQSLWTQIHRAGDPADFAADLLGIGLGVLVARSLLPWIRARGPAPDGSRARTVAARAALPVRGRGSSASPIRSAAMPDKDDKTHGRTSQPGEYARDDDGSIHEIADGHTKSHKSAQDRDADTSQGDRDEHDDAAANVPFQHGT